MKIIFIKKIKILHINKKRYLYMSLLLKIQNKIINNNKLFNANKNFNNNNNKNLVINKKYINNNNKIIEKNKRNKSRINSHSFHSSNSLENSNKISELSEDSFCNGNINYRHLKGLHIDKFNFQSPIINKINNFMSHKKENNDNNNNLKNIGSMTNLSILSPIKSEKSNSNNMSPKSSNYNKLDNQNNIHDNIFNYISDTNCLSDDDIKTNNNEHPFPINKNFLQNRYPLPKKESKPDYEEIHSIINENNNNNENNKIINYLLNLQPFSSKLYKTLVNFKDIFELFIKNVSQNYHSEIFDNNNIIFKYGDEADKFYIIHHGKVDLLFPFIDNIEMSIDEYFIYLMKLRIYDEFEIINEVLLINQGVFMEDSNENENFSFDDWIITAFNTLLKIKFDPSFLNKDVKTKKKKNNNSKNNNKSSSSNNKNNNSSSKKNSNNNSIISSNKSNNRNSNLNSIYPSFKNSSMKNSNNNSFNNTSSKNKNEKKNKISLLNEEGFNDDEYKTFQSKEIKELILRIENELKLTIKVCFPHLYKEIVIDKFNNYKKVIVKMKVADLSKIKIFNNTQEFIDRINPNFLFKENNKNVPRKKIFVIKYLFLRTLKKGDFFGEILPEKLNFFSSELLKYFKKSQFNLKLHQFTHFRTMTAIAVKEEDEFINNNNKNYNNNKIYIGSITKKLYFETLKKFSEKLSNEKYDFLLNNKLFINTRNQNLIKTYSKCFQLKIIKEGEYLISQNKKLNPENTNIYFIKKGEFQSKCKKNIIQIDEVLTTLGYGEKIEETFPSKLKSLIDTPFYDNIIKKYFNLKLNYIGKGEIVGICEKFNENYFFNDVVCCSKEAIVYEVNSKIVNFLIESEEVIIENKNKILFGKYKVLCDMLLKQRKIFFECFFHMQNDILNDKKTKNNNSNVNNSNNNNSCLNVDNENNNNSIINNNNNNRLNLKKKILLLEKKNINNKSFYHHKSKNFSSDFLFYKNNNNSKYNNNSKNNSSINKEIIYKDLGDLDIVLSKVNSSYTFADIREKKKMEFKKKYEKLQEQKKLILLKKNNEINNNNKNNNKSLNYNEFKKYFLLSSQLRKILPEIKINKNIDENTKVIIDYNNNNNNDNNNDSNIVSNNINNININNKISNENNNLNKINLLIYDNFNRTYNTTKYFNSYFKNNSLKIQRKNSPPEFSINLKNNIKNNIKKNHNFIKSKTDRNYNKFQTDKNKNNDIVTNRLRRIYCSKFEKELYHEYKMNKYF